MTNECEDYRASDYLNGADGNANVDYDDNDDDDDHVPCLSSFKTSSDCFNSLVHLYCQHYRHSFDFESTCSYNAVS